MIKLVKKETHKKNNKNQIYEYPKETNYEYSVEKYFNNPPNSKSWVHGIQKDDVLDADTERRTKTIEKLKKIKIPVQRSKEWYKQRETMITASAIASAIGCNHHEPQYRFILSKLVQLPFLGEKPAYHGKKFESISTMIYEYRMNVIVYEYGCIEHDCGFIGASPDGIVDIYKLDKIHKTNLVGRMLEIKNVETRKINMTSDNILEVIPEYYYPQPQIQMQACKLDECDFFQCNIKEYTDRQSFIDDTDMNEPFRSKSTGFEKGVLIQLVPFGDIDGKGKLNVIYNHTKFIYPPKIEMTPFECDQWVCETISTYRKNKELEKYLVDRVIYWKLVECRSVTVKRDDKWFKKYYPILEKMWKYVSFLRKNEEQKKIFIDYVNFMEKDINHNYYSQLNDNIMDVVEKLYDIKNKKYKKILKSIKDEMVVKQPEKTINNDVDNDFDDFTIC
jgi:putative phage-type endonuclease